MSNQYTNDPTVIDVEVEDGGNVAGTRFTPGNTLILDDYDVLQVNVTDQVEKGNPLPVSSEAVRTSIDEALDPWISKVEGEKEAFLEEAESKLQQVSAQADATMQQVTAQTNTTLAEAKAELDADKNAFLEDAGDALEEIREVVQDHECAPPIVCQARGETILVQDSAERLLHGLTLYGKTTQNGTPTPEARVELVSVGANGSVGVTVAGKNLVDKLDDLGVYQAVNIPKGSYITVNALLSGGNRQFNIRCKQEDETLKYYSVAGLDSENHVWHSLQFVAEKNITGISFVNVSATGTNNRTVEKIMVRLGNYTTMSDADYEPYKSQTLTAFTPNGLPGIPVSSGGNYTDANGQQWVCDEVDFARGVYVQRNYVLTFDGTEDWRNDSRGFMYFSVTESARSTVDPIYSTHYQKYNSATGQGCILFVRIGTGFNQMRAYNVGYDNSPEWKAYLAALYAAGTPLKVMYILATPIETPVSAEEMAQYAALHTNRPNTTVYNDSGAGMAMAYVADTKTYIDNKLAAISGAVLNA